jgi:hypothetical protein
MHDPLVVAFEIRRPWPHTDRAMTVDGREVPAYRYWPPLVTVWHREPGGHDSGDICEHYRRYQDDAGEWQMKILRGWRFHAHHWKIQVHALQRLRRRLLTRCAWCGGRSRKRDVVNFSRSWDGPRGRWWQGEPGLYHHDCSSVAGAHATCVCEHPVLEYNGYGQCARCNAFRAWGATDEHLGRARKLREIPAGKRRGGG